MLVLFTFSHSTRVDLFRSGVLPRRGTSVKSRTPLTSTTSTHLHRGHNRTGLPLRPGRVDTHVVLRSMTLESTRRRTTFEDPLFQSFHPSRTSLYPFVRTPPTYPDTHDGYYGRRKTPRKSWTQTSYQSRYVTPPTGETNEHEKTRFLFRDERREGRRGLGTWVVLRKGEKIFLPSPRKTTGLLRDPE